MADQTELLFQMAALALKGKTVLVVSPVLGNPAWELLAHCKQLRLAVRAV
jgi:hypothetical protein